MRNFFQAILSRKKGMTLLLNQESSTVLRTVEHILRAKNRAGKFVHKVCLAPLSPSIGAFSPGVQGAFPPAPPVEPFCICCRMDCADEG